MSTVINGLSASWQAAHFLYGEYPGSSAQFTIAKRYGAESCYTDRVFIRGDVAILYANKCSESRIIYAVRSQPLRTVHSIQFPFTAYHVRGILND